MLAGDVFVYHEGAVSFSEDRSALTESAGKTLADLHPDYVRKVREFAARDEASALRAAVDDACTDLKLFKRECSTWPPHHRSGRLLKERPI